MKYEHSYPTVFEKVNYFTSESNDNIEVRVLGQSGRRENIFIVHQILVVLQFYVSSSIAIELNFVTRIHAIQIFRK